MLMNSWKNRRRQTYVSNCAHISYPSATHEKEQDFGHVSSGIAQFIFEVTFISVNSDSATQSGV